MSRYHAYEDEDEYRLPEGLQRVGYDADTQTYTFQSSDGTIYSGLPGNRYGKIVPASQLTDIDQEEIVRDNREAWRYMLPFFLLVIAFLFFLVAPPWRRNFGQSPSIQCDDTSFPYEISSGETCWRIADTLSTNVEHLKSINPGLDCDRLQIGSAICVPKVDI